ncbi:uncharacterized protein PV09_05179 [Verruconis gallopava]|uniref:Exoribonuclease phosphorolytic domain-containing protein n=1 Tax=Verruconis gallopava TaxID=253628 RepID=A0A0D1XMT2_9PEZI|nr:uncharacterized protein PV09_05179 [Verruconis gallopava]KIW03886.1 hypothetical protein PV09_05179 [Verruconis gallopava]
MGASLHRADGSATYSADGYTAVAAVNGPLEVQRRDELPEEAAIEVNIRPAIGVGSTRERHLESLIQSTLKSVVLTKNFPRTLIQITVQMINTPDQTSMRIPGLSSTSYLPGLPVLLQASLLALISGAIPLETTYAAIAKRLSASYHVFVFSGENQLLLAESEGDFSFKDWQCISEEAKHECITMIQAMRSSLGE